MQAPYIDIWNIFKCSQSGYLEKIPHWFRTGPREGIRKTSTPRWENKSAIKHQWMETEQNQLSKIFNTIAVYSFVWAEKVCKLRADRGKNWEGSWENGSVIIYGKKEEVKKSYLKPGFHISAGRSGRLYGNSDGKLRDDRGDRGDCPQIELCSIPAIGKIE